MAIDPATAKRRTVPLFKISLLLFLSIYIFLVLTSSGHVYGNDGASLFLTAKSFAERFAFDVPRNPNTLGGKEGIDHKWYTPFGIGQPILLAPFVMLGKSLSRLFHNPLPLSLSVSLFNPLITALIALLFFHFLIILEFNIKSAALFSIALISSTLLWPYSKFWYSEPLTALLTLVSVYCIFKFQQSNKLGYLALSGCAAGYLLLVRIPAGIILPPLFLFLLLSLKKHKNSSLLYPLFLWSLPVIICILGVFYYNFHRFGHFLETGYDKLPDGNPRAFTTPLSYGLAVLLFSPGKSLFLFNPLLLAFFIGIRPMFRRYRNLTGLILLSALLYLLTYAQWCRPEGGYSWGPRLLIPVIPLLAVPAFYRLKSAPKKFTGAFVILLIIAGVAIQFLGAAVNFAAFIQDHETEYYDPLRKNYNFFFNPIPGHFKRLLELSAETLPLPDPFPEEIKLRLLNYEFVNLRGVPDFWFFHLLRLGIPLLPITASFCFLLLGLIVSSIRLAGLLRIAAADDQKHKQ